MRNRLAPLSLVAVLALVVSACGGGDADSGSAGPDFVVQGSQSLDTSDFATTTTAPAGGAGGASEGGTGAGAGEETESPDGDGDGTAGTTTLPQNEVSQEEAVDDMFTAMRTFNSCLEDEGTTFLGDPRGAAPDDPASAPEYLEALTKCAAVSQIQDAMASLDLGSEGKTPEEIEEQNRGLVGFVDCLKGRGWDPAPLEPDENGLLQVGDLGAPDGENLFDSNDMDDCRRIGQQNAADEAES